MLDQNKDKQISMKEINSLTEGGLEFAAKLFPMYMTEDDEIENESEIEDQSDEELLPMTDQKKTELWF